MCNDEVAKMLNVVSNNITVQIIINVLYKICFTILVNATKLLS